jgi:hypothetical protein
MKDHHTRRAFRNACVLIITTTILAACLDVELDDVLSEEELAEVESDNNVSGSVGDGPVVGSSIRILKNDGTELAKQVGDSSANYNLVVRTKGKFYPLSIESRDGTDLVTDDAPDFDLLSAVLEPSKKSVANINPFSTLAVELARDMSGGENKSNLGSAQDIVATQFNSGLLSLKSSGPMTTPISGSNIAEIVRASETLGETVRRTRDAVAASGFTTSGNAVVRALASDLTDEIVDGLGGRRADARIAAVSTVVAAQVLLETMANELHVNGSDATQKMKDAINQVSRNVADPSLDNLVVTSGMLERARIGLDAAYVVTSDPLIDDLHSMVKEIPSGTSSRMIRDLVLPVDYRSRLDQAVLLVSGGSVDVHETVNTISRDGSSDKLTPTDTNSAPTISGDPATSVVAGSAYTFTPSATDADGDLLIFTLNNTPRWAFFDTSTGTITGTPSGSDVGVYADLVISVTDSVSTSNLSAFTINVTAATPTNSAPQISGSPLTTVLAGDNYIFTPNASDSDGDRLTFTGTGLPSWATLDPSNGQLSGRPGSGDVGVDSDIRISVSDGQASDSLSAFSITVTALPPENSAPEISGSPPPTVLVDASYSFTPDASDSDGDNLTFSGTGLPGWANLDPSNGRLSGRPDSGDVGVYSNIRISVSDGQASDSLPAFTITVDAIALGSATLSWTAPTQNTDGSGLSDLAGFNIYWGTVVGSYPNKITINNASISTYVVENLVPGTYRFVATSFAESGIESDYSGVAVKSVP